MAQQDKNNSANQYDTTANTSWCNTTTQCNNANLRADTPTDISTEKIASSRHCYKLHFSQTAHASQSAVKWNDKCSSGWLQLTGWLLRLSFTCAAPSPLFSPRQEKFLSFLLDVRQTGLFISLLSSLPLFCKSTFSAALLLPLCFKSLHSICTWPLIHLLFLSSVTSTTSEIYLPLRAFHICSGILTLMSLIQPDTIQFMSHPPTLSPFSPSEEFMPSFTSPSPLISPTPTSAPIFSTLNLSPSLLHVRSHSDIDPSPLNLSPPPFTPLSQTEWPCHCWLEPAWPDAQLGLAEACGKESCLF